jgi:hypothetical protein
LSHHGFPVQPAGLAEHAHEAWTLAFGGFCGRRFADRLLGPLGDQLPQGLGGLPAGTPPPPATPYQYPAVHDMPPPRSTEPMTEEQQYRLEKELNALRERQEGAQAQDKKPAKKAAKKKPAPAQTGQNTGAKTNP